MTRQVYDLGILFSDRPEFRQLVTCMQRGETFTPAQAARFMGIHPTAIYRRIEYLQARGMVYVVRWQPPTARGLWVPVYAWRDAGQTDAAKPPMQTPAEACKKYREKVKAEPAARRRHDPLVARQEHVTGYAPRVPGLFEQLVSIGGGG